MLTIATPNPDRSLLTLDERKAALGIAAADNSRDTEITALGGYVDATITRACKVAVAGDIPPNLRLEPVTETFRTKDRVEVVCLSRRPISTVTTVSEAGAVLVADVDYEIVDEGLARLVNGSRSCWGALVVADYSAGWAVVPDDLKYAAIKFTQAEWNGGGQPRDPWLKSVRIEGVSQRDYWVDPTVDSVIPADVMDILDSGGYIIKTSWVK